MKDRKTPGPQDALRFDAGSGPRFATAIEGAFPVIEDIGRPSSHDVHFAWDSPDTEAFQWEAPVVSVASLLPRASRPSGGTATRKESGSIAWGYPGASRAPKPAPAVAGDPAAERIRERYFTVRFPGAPSLRPDTAPASLVKSARLYFEDGDSLRAVELLECASQALPAEPSLWLARLEILFLSRRGEAFVAAARRFRESFPQSPQWSEVERLGWRLAPQERLFAAGRPQGASGDEHFGAWPEAPNWIEAPWDLTGEVLAVELRGRVLGTATARAA